MDGIGNAGGIQEMAIKWMENIDHSKFQVDILSYNTGKKDNYVERVKALGSQVYIVDTYMRKGTVLKSFSQTQQFFATHHYDILHAHSSSKAFFVMWFAKRAGIKTRILHSHCTKFIVTKKIPLLIANLLKKPTMWLTTDYFACSPEAGQFLFGKKALKRKKITITHNGIDTEIFQPNEDKRDAMRNALGIGENFVIGNVGRFRPQKNHEFLIEIFRSIYYKDKDAVLVCVGNGELEDEIKKKARVYGIDDRILFLGFRSDVNDLMHVFDVLLMPSLFEGLPVTGVEAQAEGVPAVFADTITKDAAILPESIYIPLEESPEKWAAQVLAFKNYKQNTDAKRYITERGYDIRIETQKLADYYNLCAERE